MKKLVSLLLALSLVVIPYTASFADEKVVDDSTFKEVELLFKANDNLLKASTHGNGGTAYLGFMSGAKALNWRVTSSKGPVILFEGYIKVFNSSNKLVTAYPVSGGGVSSSISKQVSVRNLKKGTYKAVMTGSGTTGAGHLSIKEGLVQFFSI